MRFEFSTDCIQFKGEMIIYKDRRKKTVIIQPYISPLGL